MSTGAYPHDLKVQIGCLYVPPQARMPAIYGDAALLQQALLDKRTAKPLTAFWRLLGAIWRWA